MYVQSMGSPVLNRDRKRGTRSITLGLKMTYHGSVQETSTRFYFVNSRSFVQIEGLRECLADIGLADLGFLGYPYTCNNERDAEENIQVTLD